MPAARRLPPPWSIEELAECCVIRDANGQAIAYVYFEEEPGRRAAAKLLAGDEARRIAANIGKLPQKHTGLYRTSAMTSTSDFRRTALTDVMGQKRP
jgi:hypothetical protein